MRKPADLVTVLLVDDNPDDVSIIRRLLTQYQRMHIKVLAASNLSSCLELLAGDRADLLLLDYSLPAEDGLSFLRRANTLVEMPPAIIITGLNDYRLAAEAIRSGASDCIYKHAMTSQTLGQAVQQALAKFRHDEELNCYDDNLVYAFVESTGRIPTTGGSSVANLAERLGQQLELGDYQVSLLRVGALLHDVGKLGVRHEVILKPGPLDETELEEVRRHPLIGERLCMPLRRAREIAPIIRHHHEWWDGSGYVDGLAGDEIPYLARVVSVVDAFDAMTQDRPYRAALGSEEAMRRLRAGAGSQWDPQIIGEFVKMMQGEVELLQAA